MCLLSRGKPTLVIPGTMRYGQGWSLPTDMLFSAYVLRKSQCTVKRRDFPCDGEQKNDDARASVTNTTLGASYLPTQFYIAPRRGQYYSVIPKSSLTSLARQLHVAKGPE